MSILSFLLFLTLPIEFETSTFTVVVEGREIGSEEFTISPQGDGYLARGRTRLSLNGETVDIRSVLELDADLNPVSYEYRSGANVLHVDINQPTAAIRYTSGGDAAAYDIRMPEDAVIIDDNFFHHYVLLLYRVGRDGGEVPAFVPQQMTLGSVEIKSTGEGTYEIATDNLRLLARTDANGRLVRLEGIDANVLVRR